MATSSVRAITFDFGQTLADLDPSMLRARLLEKGVDLAEDALERGVAPAFETYGRAIQKGAGGHPWELFMRTLLEGAGAAPGRVHDLAAWLFSEQPKRNLWRRRVPGMFELVEDLVARGVPVGIISNSEGRLAELVAELGHAHLFRVIADSGKLGLEKPKREIFVWTAERLGVSLSEIAHVGDAYAADVTGALDAGALAIWFRGQRDTRAPVPRMRTCAEAGEVRAALADWGVPLPTA